MERMGIRARNNNNNALLKGEGKDEEDRKSSGHSTGTIITNRDRVNCRKFVIHLGPCVKHATHPRGSSIKDTRTGKLRGLYKRNHV